MRHTLNQQSNIYLFYACSKLSCKSNFGTSKWLRNMRVFPLTDVLYNTTTTNNNSDNNNNTYLIIIIIGVCAIRCFWQSMISLVSSLARITFSTDINMNASRDSCVILYFIDGLLFSSKRRKIAVVEFVTQMTDFTCTWQSLPVLFRLAIIVLWLLLPPYHTICYWMFQHWTQFSKACRSVYSCTVVTSSSSSSSSNNSRCLCSSRWQLIDVPRVKFVSFYPVLIVTDSHQVVFLMQWEQVLPEKLPWQCR